MASTRFPRIVIDNKITPFIFRIILGGLFIYASVDKILYPAEFAEAVRNYQILPLGLVNIVAVILPWVELVAGLLLLNGFKTRSGNTIILILICVFIFGVVSAMIKGIDIHCGCFSTEGGRKVGMKALMEDVVLLLMSISILFFDKGFFSIDGLLSKRRLKYDTL